MNRTIILGTALVACLLLGGCGMESLKKETAASVQKETTTPETTAEAENISVGYIHVPDTQTAVDLYSEIDGGTTMAKMFHQDPVTVYSITGDWAKISYGGMVGFVELKYLSFTEPTAPVKETESQTSTPPAVAADNTPINVEQNVNIVFMSDGDGFQIAEPTYYVDYVSGISRNAWCSAQSIYIFSQPDANSEKREANMLYYGDTLTVEGSVGEWYYISTDSGNGYDLHGYVKQKYITFGDSPAAPEPANATQGRVNVGSANVRSSPNKENDSNVLFTLHDGDTFDVLSYDGYWYQINYNGTICYISHKMVEVW